MSNDVTMPPQPLDPDATLAPSPEVAAGWRGNSSVPGYEILGELGRGGMGVVYQARQSALNRVVALKMILAGAHADESGRERFRAEAEAIARLQHPNIVGVYEIGEHDGHPYFSLEFCAGGSLEKKLGGTPTPPRDAAQLVMTLAGAVQAAHDAGVVHRDLKPANVLLSVEGQASVFAHEVKITDFGLARRLDQDSNQTRSGAIVGTPSYMAPEQAGGKTREVGPACDIWALGAILYECLTGRPPFRAATALDTVLQVVADDPVPPSRLNARTPRDLETIALKCLQKEQKKRYASAAELADDLRRFLADEPIRARPVGVAERALKWVRRRPAIAGLILLCFLLTVAGVLGVLDEWKRAEEQRERAERQAERADQARLLADRRAEAEAAARQDANAARKQAEAALGRARNGLYFFDLLRAQTALKDGQPDRALSLLNDSPLDLRGWEWHHLSQTNFPDPVPCVGHAGDAWAVAWSSDEKTLVTGGMDGTIRLWNPATGTEIRKFDAHKGQWMSRFAFSPDGRWLASATLVHDMKLYRKPADWERSITGEVMLWDASTWREVRKLPGWFTVSFHPDGKRLATISGRYAQVVEVETGRVVTTMLGHTLPVQGAVFTPDGTKVISWAYDANRIQSTDWNLTTPIKDFSNKDKDIRGEVMVWDAVSGLPSGPAVTEPPSGPIFVEVHPDGKRLVAATLGGTVTAWSLKTGKPLHTVAARKFRTGGLALRGNQVIVSYLDNQAMVYNLDTGAKEDTILGPSTDLALSPSQRWLANGGARGLPVRIYDLQRGGSAARLDLGGEHVVSCAFSPDGERLAVLTERPGSRLRLRLVDAKQMKVVHTSDTLGIRLTYTPDGKRLITGGLLAAWGLGNGELLVRDAATGRVQMSLKGHDQVIVSVSVSADSRWLVSASHNLQKANTPGAIMVWDLANNGERVRTIPQDKQAFGAAISPDGRTVAAACIDGVVRLWDRESGRPTHVLTGHDTPVKSVAFRPPDGRQLAAGDFAGKILLWDTVTFERQHELRDRSATLNSGFTALTYSHDGRRLASATYGQPAGGEVRVWDPDSGVEAYTLDGKLAVAFSPDGHRIASGGGDGGKDPFHLRVWDATPRPLVMARKESAAHIHNVAASRDGRRFATAGDDGVVRVWSAATGQVVRTLSRSGSRVVDAAFSPDGQRLAAGGTENAVHVWRLDTGELVRTLTGHEKYVRKLTWIDDERLASASEDTTVRVWDVKTGQTLHRLKQEAVAASVAVSPDGKRLLVGADTWRVYDADTGAQLLAGEGAKELVWSVAFRPDGKRFAASGNTGWLRVFDAGSGKQVLEMERRPSAVYALGWSRDGKRLVSAGDDPTLRVHDAEKGTRVTVLAGHRSHVTSLTCLDDGLVASGDGGGEVRLWQLPGAGRR